MRFTPIGGAGITVAAIDCCVLANNHVLDWGYPGFEATLASLVQAGLHTAGAGTDRVAAQTPAVLPLPGQGRVLVIAAGQDISCGVVISVWYSRLPGAG